MLGFKVLVRIANLKIEDVAFGGKGVARENGKAVFIPFTIDSETVQAEIVREKKKFAEAELIEVMSASPERVPPECPYFGRCGGCSYQHISYSHQLSLKWRQVRDVLQRIGKFSDVPMRPIIPSPKPYGYRNRATVHAEDGVVGFYRRDSHRLIDIEKCPISSEVVNAELQQLRKRRPRDGHFTLREHPGARIFSQTNDSVAGQLLALVETFIPDAQELLVDAYCGSGFFARGLLGRFERVVGIDWDRYAIEEAEKGAGARETYIAGDVAAELNRMRSTTRSLTLIVDPPAAGLPPEVRSAIVKLAPQILIYVSCNPATLARDLADFTAGHDLLSITPLDMFPQTAEIEVVANLQARSVSNHDI